MSVSHGMIPYSWYEGRVSLVHDTVSSTYVWLYVEIYTHVFLSSQIQLMWSQYICDATLRLQIIIVEWLLWSNLVVITNISFEGNSQDNPSPSIFLSFQNWLPSPLYCTVFSRWYWVDTLMNNWQLMWLWCIASRVFLVSSSMRTFFWEY